MKIVNIKTNVNMMRANIRRSVNTKSVSIKTNKDINIKTIKRAKRKINMKSMKITINERRKS